MDAGIVHQYMQAAKLGQCRLTDLAPGSFTGHIMLQTNRLATLILDRLNRFLSRPD